MARIVDYMSFALVHGRRVREKGDVVSSVELRVCYQYKQKYFATGVRCLASEWDGRGVRGRKDAAALNARLDDIVRKAREVEERLRERGALSLDGFAKLMRANGDKGAAGARGFWEFCEERVAVRSHGRTRWTEVRYRRLLAYLRERFSWAAAEDVQEVDLVRLDAMLVREGVSEGTRWHNYHRYLKALLSDAVKAGMLRRNPYDGGVITRPKDDGRALERYLSEEEMERMKRVELPAGHLSRVRDLFLFQCYTCMGFADLRDFSSSRLEEVGGRLMYSSRRNKTGCAFSFMLLRGAEEILKKYGGVLPLISAQKYNLYLKEVARMAGISRPVTSHWARHTGATLLLNAGVRLEVVARVLGHSSTEMTRKVYAKLLDDTVAREMMKAEEKL